MWIWVLLSSIHLWAAPFPGSSIFSKNPGVYFSDKGFQIDSAQTAWIQSSPPAHIPSLVTVYKAPVPVNGETAALTVRVDELKKPENLTLYVRHWMRDYNRFGFEVLAAKPVHVKKTAAFLLDIVSHETHKQLRQVLFMRGKTAVILTCRDEEANFQKTVKDCDHIIESFRWE